MNKLSSIDILAMNVKYYRFKLKLSQEKFAELVDSNLKYINQIENSVRNPSLEFIDRIADALGIEAHELITYNKEHEIIAKRVDQHN